MLATLLVALATGCGSGLTGPSSGDAGSAAAVHGPTGRTEPARVLEVVDGDTIRVDRGRGPERVRYIGIDTPETQVPGGSAEPMARAATRANAALVEGRDVVMELDVSETDRFGRLLRHVWLRRGDEWLLVSLELVRRGYAHAATFPPDVRYADVLVAAQREAASAGRGLWAAPDGQ